MPVSATENWQSRKWLAIGEGVVIALICFANWQGLIPVSKTPFILLFAWLLLRLRGARWQRLRVRRSSPVTQEPLW